MEIEETITNINYQTDEITLGPVIFSAKPGLVRQALDHFPIGTTVKATIENDEVKNLVKREEELQWIG